MINQPSQKLIDAIPRLKHIDEFKLFGEYLQENIWYMAEMACRTGGEAKYEFSGAFKAFEALMGVLNLEEYKQPGKAMKRFE